MLLSLLENYESAFAFVINRSTSARTSKIIYLVHCEPAGLWIISHQMPLNYTKWHQRVAGQAGALSAPAINNNRLRPSIRPHPISWISRGRECVRVCVRGKCHWDNWKLIMLTYLESDCWDGDSLMMPAPYNFQLPEPKSEHQLRPQFRTVADNQRPTATEWPRVCGKLARPAPHLGSPGLIDACQVAIHLVTARQAFVPESLGHVNGRNTFFALYFPGARHKVFGFNWWHQGARGLKACCLQFQLMKA